MSKQKEIGALRKEISSREKQIYRANKESNAWSKGMARSPANMKNTQLFIETQRREIAVLKSQLLKLEKTEKDLS